MTARDPFQEYLDDCERQRSVENQSVGSSRLDVAHLVIPDENRERWDWSPAKLCYVNRETGEHREDLDMVRQ